MSTAGQRIDVENYVAMEPELAAMLGLVLVTVGLGFWLCVSEK